MFCSRSRVPDLASPSLNMRLYIPVPDSPARLSIILLFSTLPEMSGQRLWPWRLFQRRSESGLMVSNQVETSPFAKSQGAEESYIFDGISSNRSILSAIWKPRTAWSVGVYDLVNRPVCFPESSPRRPFSARRMCMDGVTYTHNDLNQQDLAL